MKGNKELSKLFMMLSLVAIVLAGIGYLKQDIWLASTQWLLVSIVFGVYATYLKK
ncbi:hypothetical protein KW795_01810 [Candidatus Microgenomates bacterium]|nr:hypothetical protein [Candidatus Microgenomates bacterium]